MKKLFTLQLCIMLLSGSIAQTLPNSGFENWSQADPDSWKSSNFMIPSSVSKSASSYSGANAARLETKTYTFTAAPGSLTLGKITQNGFSANVSGGIPFTGRPDSLVGYYKSTVQSGDASYFGIGLFKRNPSSGILDTIALGKITKSSSASDYTRFSVPVYYRSSETPDTLNILLMSSANIVTAVVGSVLYVDDLSLVYHASGIEFQTSISSPSLSFYPNPAGSVLIVQAPNATSVDVINNTGQIVKQVNCDETQISFALDDLPSGSYVVRAHTPNSCSVGKLLICR